MDKARFALIKLLNKKFEITLAVLIRKDINIADIKEVKSICSDLVIVNHKYPDIYKFRIIKKLRTFLKIINSALFYVPMFVGLNYSRRFKHEISKLLKVKQFDIVQPLSDYSINYAYNLKTKSFKFYGPNDDMAGMTEEILKLTKNKRKRRLLKIELFSRMKWQKRLLKESNKSCFFSKRDIENISLRNPVYKDKLVWMPGVIEYEDEWNKSSIHTVESNTLVFTGGLVSEFNKISLEYFLNEIWELIINEIKDVKLYVVGQCNNVETYQIKYSKHNVIFTGQVQSVRDYLERAAVFISPVICGTGIKTKVIEALRFGKPVVTTPEGVRGLWELPSDIIKIRSNAKDFSQEVITLLNNEKYRIETCLASRKLFEEHYSFDKLTPGILDIYDNLIL